MNQIIQLKQSDGFVNKNPTTGENLNGDYEVNLDQKIVIEQGDTLVVKNSFIDTEASNSAQINVQPNTVITTQTYLYINDIVTDGNIIRNLDNSQRTNFTGKPFIACRKKAGSGAELKQVDKITVHINTNPINPGETIATSLTYNYNDAENNRQSYKGTYVLPLNFKAGDDVTYDIGTTITFQDDIDFDTSDWNFQFCNKPQLADLGFAENNNIIPYPGKVENVNDVYEPIILSNQIPVPAGNYDPDNLITLLNTKTQLNTPTDARLMNTPYLCITDNSTPAKLITPDPNIGTVEVYFFDETGTDAFSVAGGTAQIYVGTDNFAFGYEPSQSQFTIDYIHFPFINNADGTRAVALVKTTNLGNNNPGDYKLLNAYGGIMFNNIDDTTGLLRNAMNFDLTSLKVATTQIDFNILGIPGKCPKISAQTPIVLAKNITAQLVVMNSFVDKRQNQTFYVPPVDTNNQITQTFFSASPDTYQILAGPSVIKKTFNFGYFLIEIEAKFPTNIYTAENTFKFIKQIVGRYYESNSFTQGESGQIVYQHQSAEPLYLNNFKVRILNPNYQVPTGLGPNSAVFLEHVKGGVLPPSKPPTK